MDQAWHRFLWNCGCLGVPIPNNEETAAMLWAALPFAGLLLTGGNDVASLGGDVPERDAVELRLVGEARRDRLPIIGVCRGMQVLQSLFGVSLTETPGHVSDKQRISLHGTPAWVNSYHRMGAYETVPDLSVWGTSNDGVIKAIHHQTEPILGVMWHPERIQPFRRDDRRLFRSHFGIETS